MRRLNLGSPVKIGDPEWVFQALKKIEQESIEDIESVFDAYSYTGTLTETRVLNLTAPTAANIAAVLATMISDIQKRGQNRTGG